MVFCHGGWFVELVWPQYVVIFEDESVDFGDKVVEQPNRLLALVIT